MYINILFPVWNEELRLKRGIETTIFFARKELRLGFHLTIIDNASTDRTPEIARDLAETYPEVQYIRIEEKGVGIAFKTGVQKNTDEIVGYMDIDLSTDLKHLLQVEESFLIDDPVQIVNGSRYSKKSDLTGGKWYRIIFSYGLVWLLKLSFGMKATDAICGFKFFRKDTVEKLLEECTEEPGWFYIIELLIRAEKQGYNIREIPVRWVFDEHTTVKVIPVVLSYLRGIRRLKRTLKREKKRKSA